MTRMASFINVFVYLFILLDPISVYGIEASSLHCDLKASKDKNLSFAVKQCCDDYSTLISVINGHRLLETCFRGIEIAEKELEKEDSYRLAEKKCEKEFSRSDQLELTCLWGVITYLPKEKLWMEHEIN